MKALITNAAMTLLDDQITNEADKGVVDLSYGLIPNGYLLIQDGLALRGVTDEHAGNTSEKFFAWVSASFCLL